MTDNTREVVRNQLLLGAPGGKVKHFVPWHHSIDHSLRKISHAYRPKTS